METFSFSKKEPLEETLPIPLRLSPFHREDVIVSESEKHIRYIMREVVGTTTCNTIAPSNYPLIEEVVRKKVDFSFELNFQLPHLIGLANLQPGTVGSLSVKEVGPLGLSKFTSRPRATVFPRAVEYAKTIGAYGSIFLAVDAIKEVLPSSRVISVDAKDDPDEGGYKTICFSITVRENVEKLVELNRLLQSTLYERVPNDHLAYLAFTYKFV